METIRKKICLDKFLSHRNGIVPYVAKDEEFDGIKYVKTISSDSNYGSFPCDFTFINSYTVFDKQTGISYRENVEVSRLRYLDVISMYSKSSEIVNNGVILKKVHYSEDANSCDEEEGGDITPPEPDPNPEPCYTDCAWVKDDTVSKYNCKVVDGLFFVKDDSGFYFFNRNCETQFNSLIERYNIDFNESTEIDIDSVEDKNFIEKYLYFIGINNDGVAYCSNNILIVDEYDEYIKNEKKWDEWWEANWPLCSFYSLYNRWENYVFDSLYHEPLSLKFIYDIEKYVIGKVNVTESYGGVEIDGSKVPEYVFYLNYMDYLRWFTENEEYLDTNDTINNEWEKRGGVGFRNFLFSISPKFFDNDNIPNNGDVVYFTFSIPNIEIPVSFSNEFYNETSYLPYEYSVVDDNIVNGTVEYVCGGNGQIESALTPNFVYFMYDEESGRTAQQNDGNDIMFELDGPIKSESKLTDLTCNDVYYIDNETYGVFNNFENGGCLFYCTFYTGNSMAEISTYTSGCVKYYAKNSNNEWNEVKSIKIPEKYDCTLIPGVMPKTHAGAYQVVGIKFIESSVTITDVNTYDSPPCFNDDGKLKIVSSTTIYNKNIVKKYSWCECKKMENQSSIPCGDGENIDFNGTSKYRNLLLLSCVPSASESVNNGDSYYYMIKYDNGYTNIGGNKEINLVTNSIKTLSLPYIVGQEMNRESYSGDFENMAKYDMVTNEEVVDGTLIIDYVVGATVGADIEKSGIHYRDKYIYNGNLKKKVVVDGIYDAEILYESIDFNKKHLVYSDDLQAYRKCIVSEITGMEIGTQWTSESSVRAYLFTDDTFDNLMEYPKINVDISYNRGKSAAWEKHFKLTECNTFEDLENYGNNYFNL